jgi:hypothetical protein
MTAFSMQAAAKEEEEGEFGRRCNNCQGCYGFSCGICIWIAVNNCCPTWTTGAYAECNNGNWTVYCNGAGGGGQSCIPPENLE